MQMQNQNKTDKTAQDRDKTLNTNSKGKQNKTKGNNTILKNNPGLIALVMSSSLQQLQEQQATTTQEL